MPEAERDIAGIAELRLVAAFTALTTARIGVLPCSFQTMQAVSVQAA